MKPDLKPFEPLRQALGELGNHALDEFALGRVGRRELLRYAGVLGLSTLTGGLLAPGARAQAGGLGSSAGTARAATIRVAHLTPAGAVDPLTISDPASIGLINQTSEYLIDDDGDRLQLKPSLALSWSPNPRGDLWTFKLRSGVKFHDGQEFGARDVVATFDRLTDPAAGSAALSVFKGVLSRGGTRMVDAHTVQFHLDAPNGNFPYYVSSDTYNAVILPANYTGGYEKAFPGTGPFKFAGYQPKVGASFVRNADYWGTRALPEKIQFTFYADNQSQILAMQGGQADVMGNFSVQGGLGLLNNPGFKVISVKSSSQRQMHMRCDLAPFNDKRVRQAIAYGINRDVLVRGLFKGRAQLGNDSPFAPVFPSTDTTVPQRAPDLQKARQLLAAAGHPNGFATTLTTERFEEMPDLAVVVQNALKPLGVNLTLKVESQSEYYGAASFGKSDWLDAPLGITDYGHRGVPNVFLGAPLKSDGSWNAAHFKNPRYDSLLADYVAALDISSQKKAAGQIQSLLLDETPLVIPYFFDALAVTSAKVKGVRFTAISQLYLDQAVIS
jgi:peptide/nickel transport system substrate-binding protein